MPCCATGQHYRCRGSSSLQVVIAKLQKHCMSEVPVSYRKRSNKTLHADVALNVSGHAELQILAILSFYPVSNLQGRTYHSTAFRVANKPLDHEHLTIDRVRQTSLCAIDPMYNNNKKFVTRIRLLAIDQSNHSWPPNFPFVLLFFFSSSIMVFPAHNGFPLKSLAPCPQDFHPRLPQDHALRMQCERL